MVTIKLCYKNDQRTPEPVYVSGLPRLWRIEVMGKISKNSVLTEWLSKQKLLLTSTEIEDEVVALGIALGVVDTTSKSQWAEHDIVVEAPHITGFVNWPDPSI